MAWAQFIDPVTQIGDLLTLYTINGKKVEKNQQMTLFFCIIIFSYCFIELGRKQNKGI